MKSKEEEVYRAIVELYSSKGLVSIQDVSKKTGLSYPTVHKWVKILELKRKIFVMPFGGMRILKPIGGDESGDS
jgi:transposase